MSKLQLSSDKVSGPYFISIGDAEKLGVFLDSNPNIPREIVFVDSYDRSAYSSMGLGLITDADKEDVKKIKLTAPEMGGFGGWWKYLRNAATLAPIEKDKTKFGSIPTGVLQLGGTYLINGDDIVYEYKDVVPGDTPKLEDLQREIDSLISQ